MAFDEQTQKQLLGGGIIATSICIHIMARDRTISMSRNLFTLAGNELSYSTSRFSQVLGVVAAAAFIQLQQSSLYAGATVSGLSIWGLIIAGLLIGLGANNAAAGFETQAFTFLPLFNKPTIIAVALMLGGAASSVYLKNANPDFLDWAFTGSNDVGIDIDQTNGCKVVGYGALIVFALFMGYRLFSKSDSGRSIIDSIISFLCGGLYALGLAYSGLCSKTAVQQFFTWQSGWNGDLGISLLTAIVLNCIVFYFLTKTYTPSWDAYPSAENRLWLGSILFGFGWGLCGLAIGPIIMMASTCVPQILFVLFPSMMVGYEAERIIDRIRA